MKYLESGNLLDLQEQCFLGVNKRLFTLYKDVSNSGPIVDQCTVKNELRSIRELIVRAECIRSMEAFDRYHKVIKRKCAFYDLSDVTIFGMPTVKDVVGCNVDMNPRKVTSVNALGYTYCCEETFRKEAASALALDRYESGYSNKPRLRENLQVGGCRLTEGVRSSTDAIPLVSVVTVCRNNESGISNAIESVLNQTYKNVEHIIIDGASTDNTVDVIRSYSDRIALFVSEPDRGIYSAMNKALRYASGEYIAILNSDDLFKEEFIEKSLRRLTVGTADIVYCDYETEDATVTCPDINEGVLFTQLSIKHNTFLCSKECFRTIGYFDETRKVNSDARWIRRAYLMGMSFEKISEPLVFYSTTGLSAALTDSAKENIIQESVSLIRIVFPFLSESEARLIYLSNFNTHSASSLIDLYLRFSGYCSIFGKAMKRFLEFNLAHRDGYLVDDLNQDQLLRVLNICAEYDISFSQIRYRNGTGKTARFLTGLERVLADQRVSHKPIVLHFLREFSSPSETFVYDLLMDMQRFDGDRLHVVLCDNRHLEDIRPYDFVLPLPWGELNSRVREKLYQIMWDRLAPKLVIAHFALNGFWLYERLTVEQRKVPTINMCHGIDVYTIENNKSYEKYIKSFCKFAENVCFTAVSNYLLDLLVSAGVPREKVFLAHNSISEKFSLNRKETDFYRGERELRVLSIGRLIGWKGHRFLIEALSQVSFPGKHNFQLTIIYGNVATELESLRELTRQLGVEKNIDFVPFVNFDESPGYLANFDLFALPSTYDDSIPPRTETFGVSILEAISSGLSVIGTDAGGIPEVVGEENPTAKIVLNGDSESMRSAIQEMVDSSSASFRSNSDYANLRLELFSKKNRYEAIKAAESYLGQERKKIYHFCSLGRGGASGATMNIHKQLLLNGWSSWFVTRRQEQKKIGQYIPNVIYLDPELSIDFQHLETAPERGFTTFSIDDHAISNKTIIDLVRDADVINLAWFAKFLSVKNISAMSILGIPMTVTVRDMNPISGGCHYFHGCSQWQSNCGPCPQLRSSADLYAEQVLQKKISSWNTDNITYVAISDYVRSILDRSPLTVNARKAVINNFVNEDDFFPLEDRREVRDYFSFPENKFVIGYLPSFSSYIKGHDELMKALKCLNEFYPELEVALALLSNESELDLDMPYEVIQMPQTDEVALLRKFYNAVDLVAVPSLEETFSNTAIEALACGSPVLGFQTGIMAEVLKDSSLGALAPVGDYEELAHGIYRLVTRPVDRAYCSSFALQRFSKTKTLKGYMDLYNKISSEESASLASKSEINYMSVEGSSIEVLRGRMKSEMAISRLRHERRKRAKN